MNDSPIQWSISVDAVCVPRACSRRALNRISVTCSCSYQVTLSIERAWQSCFQPISHRVSGLRQGDRTITVTSYDMVATTQIHVLGLDIYGYGAPPTICYYRFSVLHSSKSSSRALV